jgi:hypothetical protein
MLSGYWESFVIRKILDNYVELHIKQEIIARTLVRKAPGHVSHTWQEKGSGSEECTRRTDSVEDDNLEWKNRTVLVYQITGSCHWVASAT